MLLLIFQEWHDCHCAPGKAFADLPLHVDYLAYKETSPVLKLQNCRGDPLEVVLMPA